MKMKKLFLFAVFAVLFGCSNPGSEYIGKWVSRSNPNDVMEIVRNGETFLVKETRPTLFGRKGETQTTSTPAVLKDGLLQIQSALGAINIAHVKDSDTLMVPGLITGSTEYQRLK